jgi:hypothetical protein
MQPEVMRSSSKHTERKEDFMLLSIREGRRFLLMPRMTVKGKE